MAMHNPPHPGVSPPTLNRVLKGHSAISSEMALRLSKSLRRSPESWLAMQANFNLWEAVKSVESGGVGKVEFY